MSAGVISQCEAYSLMLKNYPDILNINELCEVLCISTSHMVQAFEGGRYFQFKGW